MKKFIALLLLRLLCLNSNYYMVDAFARDCIGYSEYITEDGNIWTSYDHDNGSVVLVMYDNKTESIYDDEIFAVIGK